MAAILSILAIILAFTIVAEAQDASSPDLPASNNMFGCATTDTACWNAECLHWTNYIRGEAGVAPVVMGTTAMLDNAVEHSVFMAGEGQLSHQNLIVQLDCGVNVNAENVAFSSVATNLAWRCMNLWKKSPGHYGNIVHTSMKSAVCGVHVNSSGVYCTQTLSVKVPTAQCPAAANNFTPVEQPTPTPSPSPGRINTCVENPNNCLEVDPVAVFGTTQYGTCCVCCSGSPCSCSAACTCGVTSLS